MTLAGDGLLQVNEIHHGALVARMLHDFEQQVGPVLIADDGRELQGLEFIVRRSGPFDPFAAAAPFDDGNEEAEFFLSKVGPVLDFVFLTGGEILKQLFGASPGDGFSGFDLNSEPNMRRLLSGRLVLEQRSHEDDEAKNEGDGQIYQSDGQHDGAQWRAEHQKAADAEPNADGNNADDVHVKHSRGF